MSSAYAAAWGQKPLEPTVRNRHGATHLTRKGGLWRPYLRKENALSVPFIGDPETLFQATEPKYVFVKPDLKPGDKKYYEVQAVQVTAEFLAANPGYKVVTKEQPDGQFVEASDWVVTRIDSTDGSSQQWPLKETVFSLRWKAVPNKPGYFSPRSVPTPMVELIHGGKVKTSWGEAEGAAGSFLAKYGEDDFNVITAEDLVSTYEGTDDVSFAKLAEIANA